MSYKNILAIYFTFSFIILQVFSGLAQDVKLKINLRGVAESEISLLPLTGTNAMKPIAKGSGIKNRETATITIDKDRLPGEFVLRFDYKEKESSTPYPAEKRIVISNQDLELWVNPPFCNNKDSTWFQDDEKENALLSRFSLENSKNKTQLGLLQNFLMNYEDPNSNFYQQGIQEYEKRRSKYNQWLTQQSTKNKTLFISHTFCFQYVPQIAFKGSEADKMQSVQAHYFDGVDFNDTLLLNTSNLKEWMNSYVNIYGSMSKTESMRDSLFTLAGQKAIEKSKSGNPKVYGWMVDYFYAGYESYNIKKGMAMLQQYLDDPNCLTSKRQQIIKRLDGMKKFVAGIQAPDFKLNNLDGTDFGFHAYKGTAKYKLLLFWSADCEHCMLLVNELKKWHKEPGNKAKFDVVAVSLDDTDTEVPKWEKAIKELPAWLHLRANGGVNSPVANEYAILSTPVMFLVDTESNIIKAIPDTLEQLVKALM